MKFRPLPPRGFASDIATHRNLKSRLAGFVAATWLAVFPGTAPAGEGTNLLRLAGAPQDLTPVFSQSTTAYSGTTKSPWLPLTPLAVDAEAVTEVRVNGGSFVRVAPGAPLAAGYNYLVALKNDGGIVQWGGNQYGDSVVPPAGLANVVSVACGYAFNVALLKNGTVRTWKHPDLTIPATITGATGVSAVSAGPNHLYLVKNNGSLVAWSQFPLPSGGVPNVVSICQNDSMAVAAKADGSVVAWNASGLQPAFPPAGLSGVTMVACNNFSYAALRKDGTLKLWPEDPSRSGVVPADAALKDIVSISAGENHFTLLKSNGTVISVGTGPGTQVPPGLTNVTAIASGLHYAAALKQDGSLVTWGAVPEDNAPVPQGNIFSAFPATLPVPLGMGANTVDVRLTPPSGSPTKTYSLSVNRLPEPALLDLVPDRGGLTPAFSPGVFSYTMSLPFASDSIRFRPVTQVTGTSVAANGTPLAADAFSSPVPLNPGANLLTFRTTAEDGMSVLDYQVSITREAPMANKALRFLADSSHTLTPSFSPSQLTYTHSTPLRQPRLKIWPKGEAVSSKIEVRINGGTFVRHSSGNTATLDAVIKPDGMPFWWDRSNLTRPMVPVVPVVPCGALSTGTSAYYAIRTDGTVLTRDPAYAKVPAGLGGVVEIVEGLAPNGQSMTVALKGQGNLVAWETGTGNVVSVLPAETQLIGIASGGRSLTAVRRDGTVTVWTPAGDPYPPQFPTGYVNAVDAVGGDFSSILQADGTSLVRTNSFPAANYRTTGVAGLTPGYMVSYYHLQENGSLGFPSGFAPQFPVTFPAALVDLRLARASTWSSLAVKKDGDVIAWATANDSRDGTGVPAGLKARAFPDHSEWALNLGTNLVQVRVTAENGDEENYYITAQREANLALGSVSLNQGEFPVNLSGGATSFHVTVPGGRESISFSAAPQDDTETLELNGAPLAAGAVANVALTPGQNTISLVVFDQNHNTSRTYTFVVVRALAKAEILTLTTSAGAVTPAFSPAIRDYQQESDRTDLVVWASPAMGELESRSSPGLPWQKMSRGQLLARGGTFTSRITPAGNVVIQNYTSTEPIQPAGMTGIRSIAGGHHHLLALRAEGTVVSWGYGPGTEIPAGLVEVCAIAAAADYSLALRTDGTVIGWGDNSQGQLTLPAGLTGVTAICAQSGAKPWCLAIRSDKTVVAWGAGRPGALSVPECMGGVVAVSGLSEWLSTLGTETRAAALLENGRVIQWDVLTGKVEPEFVALHDMVAISGALALRRDGALFDLKLGNRIYGTEADGVATLEGGMAVRQDGAVPLASGWTLEVRPSWVATPLVSGVDRTLEFRVTESALQPITSLDLTRRSRTELRSLGVIGPAMTPAFSRVPTTYELGVHAGSSLHLRPAPADPNSVIEVRSNGGAWSRVAAAAGFEDSDSAALAGQPVIIRENGKISGWNPKFFSATPESSLGIFGRKAVSVARGGNVNLVLLDDGVVSAAEGYEVSNPSWTPPADVRDVVAMALGESHGLALASDGRVRAWGNSADGKLAVPDGLSGVAQVRAGKHHSLALRADGSVAAWGLNSSGQTEVPSGLSGVVAIAAGHTHSMALKRDGTVVVWGLLADGSSTVPSGLRNVKWIAADEGGCVAVREDGTALRWGGTGAWSGQGATPTGWKGVLDLSSGYGPVRALLPNNQLVAWDGVLTFFASENGGQEVRPESVTMPLAIGANTIEVRVTDPADNAQEVTTLHVTRAPNADLSRLQPDGFALSPAFDPAVENYAIEVPAATGSLRLALGAQESDATIRVNGTVVTAGNIWVPLAAGNPSPISITVTSADGVTTRTFGITLSRAMPSAVAGLGLLTTGVGPLSPAFVPEQKSYQQDFRFSMASIRAVPMGVGARMEVSLNGGAWQGLHHGQRLADSNDQFLAMGPGGMVNSWPALPLDSIYAMPEGLADVVSVAAYQRHSLALRRDGTVAAWGDNSQGQSTVPTGLKKVIAIAAGSYHSMALKEDGTVVVWGAAASGVTDVPAGLNEVTAISGGLNHCLALRRDGSVVTWGTVPASLAVPAGLGPVTAIAAVNNFSSALKSNGTVTSWGTSTPTWPASPYPALMDPWGVGLVAPNGIVTPSSPGGGGTYIPADLGPVVSLLGNRAVGLAVRTDGTVRQWAAGSSPPPANTVGDTRPLFLPFPLQQGENTALVRVTAEDGISQDTYTIKINRLPNTDLSLLRLSAGTLSPAHAADVTAYSASVPFYQSAIDLTATAADATSVVKVNGVVSSNGITTVPLSPGLNHLIVDVTTSDGLTTLRRTIAVTRQPSLATWDLRGLGTNAGGVMSAFSPGVYQYQTTPPAAGDYFHWPRPASPGGQISYRRKGGAWTPLNGAGVAPAAGNSTFVIALRTDGTVAAWSTDASAGTVPAGLNNVVSLAVGNNHSMALTSLGKVVVWGSAASTMQPPAGLPETAAIASGRNHCLALGLTGTVTAWGTNTNQQTNVPATLPPAMGIAGGSTHSLALARDGRVYSWGSMAQSTVPATLPPVVAVAAGDNFSVALKNDGKVAVWGDNLYGQVSTLPATLTNVVQVACGGRHILALRADGTVVAWGDNSSGQRTVPAGLTDVVAVNAGGSFSLAVKRDGRLVVWGISTAGQRNIPAGLLVSGLESHAMVPAADGQATTEFRIVSPDGLNSRTYALNFVLPDTYTAWSAGAFPVGTAGSLTTAAADYDGDGVANILEFITGTNPAVPSLTPLSMELVAGQAELRWTRHSGLPDNLEVLEGASSLAGPWSAISLNGVVRTPGVDGAPDTITLRRPAAETRYFMRLKTLAN